MKLCGTSCDTACVHPCAQSQCILALTKADTLTDAAFDEFVVDRLLGRSKEIKELGFAGCVAVINRRESSTTPLVSGGVVCRTLTSSTTQGARAL